MVAELFPPSFPVRPTEDCHKRKVVIFSIPSPPNSGGPGSNGRSMYECRIVSPLFLSPSLSFFSPSPIGLSDKIKETSPFLYSRLIEEWREEYKKG